MKCSNPACGKEEFKVTVEHRESKKMSMDRLPVKLVCSKCGKPVKAYVTNEQMKRLIGVLSVISNNQAKSVLFLAERTKKPWWMFW